jgi:hypothetical protein
MAIASPTAIVVPGKRAGAFAGNSDYAQPGSFHNGYECEYLLGFAAVTQCEQYVASAQQAKVAMHRLCWIEHNTGRACAQEGRGNLLCDMVVLAYSGDDDFAAPAEAIEHDLDPADKIDAQTVPNLPKALYFYIQHFASTFCVVHFILQKETLSHDLSRFVTGVNRPEEAGTLNWYAKH